MIDCKACYRLILVSMVLLSSTLILKSLFIRNFAIATPTLATALLHFSLIAAMVLILIPGIFLTRIHRLQRLLHLTVLAITLTGVVYGLVASDSFSSFPLMSLFLLLLPLLLSLPGLLRKSVYTNQWTLFLSMFYFMHGFTDAYSLDKLQVLSILETIASLLLFTSLIMMVRCQRKAQTNGS